MFIFLFFSLLFCFSASPPPIFSSVLLFAFSASSASSLPCSSVLLPILLLPLLLLESVELIANACDERVGLTVWIAVLTLHTHRTQNLLTRIPSLLAKLLNLKKDEKEAKNEYEKKALRRRSRSYLLEKSIERVLKNVLTRLKIGNRIRKTLYKQ